MPTLIEIKIAATAICDAEHGATDRRKCAFAYLSTGKPCCDVCGTFGARHAEKRAREAIALEQMKAPEPRKQGWWSWLLQKVRPSTP